MDPEDFVPVIPASAVPYLKIQQGRINALSGAPAAWREAYRRQLIDTHAAIAQFLPKPLTSVLDIGGGMGGFDALLAALNPGLRVAILDGADDPAKVQKADQPYSSAGAAAEFLEANKVAGFWFFRPGDLPEEPPRKFDLIISLQAWCFHFLPSTYMAFALKCSRPGTIWVLDVRIMQRFWASDLFSQERLEPIGEAPGFTDKYTRMAFRVVS